MWQDIETAPKDGTEILGIDGFDNQSVIRWADEFECWMLESYFHIDFKRHPHYWQPLPEPPTTHITD